MNDQLRQDGMNQVWEISRSVQDLASRALQDAPPDNGLPEVLVSIRQLAAQACWLAQRYGADICSLDECLLTDAHIDRLKEVEK